MDANAELKRKLLRIILTWMALWIVFATGFVFVAMTLQPTAENRPWLNLAIYANVVPYMYLFVAIVRLSRSDT